MSDIKKVVIKKKPRKVNMIITKTSSKKGGKCGLNHKTPRGGMGCMCNCDCCKKCPKCINMKGGKMCVGEVLHACLEREITKNDIRAKPENGSNKDYTLHGKYHRFEMYPDKVINDITKQNKRSEVNKKRIKNGKMTGGKKKGGKPPKKKAQYTKPSYKRVKNATPEYAEKYGEVAKGGTMMKKMGKIAEKEVKEFKKKMKKIEKKIKKTKPFKMVQEDIKKLKKEIEKELDKDKKKKKGGSAGYKKTKNRVARLGKHKVKQRKPVKKDGRIFRD